MSCKHYTETTDDFLDGLLSARHAGTVQDHLASCGNCREIFGRERKLRHVLRDFPVPVPSEKIVDRILTEAVNRGRQTERRRMTAFAGGAIAASLVFWAIIFTPFGNTLDPAIHILKMTLHETKNVKLVMDSPQELIDAVFTIRLPVDIELQGHSGRRVITWKARVHKGKNVLILPVVARGYKGGELIAEITHNKKKKRLVVRMEIQRQGISRRDIDRLTG